MSVPQARYVTTPDGFNIAYTMSGGGTPLILMPPALNHIQLVWDWPSHRTLLEGLASRFRLIQYDPRGQGMSSRGLPADFSLADYETDLEALTRHLKLRRFVLVSTCLQGHVALRYAIGHPERVRALVLVATAISNRAWPLDHFCALSRENWDLLLWSRLPPGLSGTESQTRLNQTRQMIAPEDAIIRWKAGACSDISAVLPKLNVPTLVVHSRSFVHLSSGEAVRLAALIPDAGLALVDSDDPGDMYGRPADALAALDAFLAGLPVDQCEPFEASPSTATPRLSQRQAQVLGLIIQGKTNREIASELVLSLRTIERHLEELYAKLNVRNRAEAIAHALSPVVQQ